MTEDRPYRKGLPPEVAHQELRRHAGAQFFPEIVDAFIELHQSGELFKNFNEEELQMYVRPKEIRAA